MRAPLWRIYLPPSCLLAACVGSIGGTDPGAGAGDSLSARNGEVSAAGGRGAGPGTSSTPAMPSAPAATGGAFESIACTNPAAQSATAIRRLTRAQYSNTVLAFLGPTVHAALRSGIDALLDDSLKKGPSDFSSRISDVQMRGYLDVAEAAYLAITTKPEAFKAIADPCAQQAPVATACRDSLIARLGLKAFRRPLGPAEITKIATDVYALGSTPQESTALAVYHLLLSPDFLIAFEFGSDPNGAGPLYDLTPYEVASRLSYLLWDAPPDDALYEAARTNKLAAPQDLIAQFDRMIQSPMAKTKLRAFFTYWIAPEKFPAESYSPQLLGAITSLNATNTELEREMLEFVDHIVWSKRGSFNDLLTDRTSFARTQQAAQMYGHAAVTSSGQPQTMGGSRVGLLMRAPVLATEGNDTHPILRGSKFRQRYLCDPLPPPPDTLMPNPEFFTDQARQTMSTRDRYAGATQSASCQGCHSLINPLGYAFEDYDPIGRQRTSEKAFSTTNKLLAEHPIRTAVSNPQLESGGPASVMDGGELVRHMVNGNKATGCFARHVFRYYRVQTESPADDCLLKSLFDRAKGENRQGAPLLDVLKELVTARSFVKRQL